ncbi:hypothetical protein [Nonomuraea bangladeshensis]|uniref:hypothetical protein n=1 Tax=Nonomuraea bangladeshensis TaxID=404385 RepID=UPI003C2B4BE8
MGGVDLVPGRHHDEADADGEERADDSGDHAAALAKIVAERRGDEPVGVKGGDAGDGGRGGCDEQPDDGDEQSIPLSAL